MERERRNLEEVTLQVGRMISVSHDHPTIDTYIWRADEMRERFEFRIRDETVLQSGDDVLVLQARQRRPGAVEVPLPRWE